MILYDELHEAKPGMSHTITAPLPTLTLRVRVPRLYGLRMWLTTRLLSIVGKVCPHDIEIEIEIEE